MADMFVPQSASPMHKKPPMNPHHQHGKGSHDLSTPMPMPTNGLPTVKNAPSSAFCDFDSSHTDTRASFSAPIDDPMEEISRLRKLLDDKDKHIASIEDAKVQLLKQSMENTAKLRQLESKNSPKALMESTEFTKKLSTITAQKESKEMICLKLNREVKELCLQNARLKDEIKAKSEILGDYKGLIEKLEEEIEDMKDGGGKESRDRELLLEKMLDEIAHLNEDLDKAHQEYDELKLSTSIHLEDSSKEIEYLQSLLQKEEIQRRSDDEVVVDVLGQMENSRLSKFIYSLIKMDGKDVLDIQDLIVLLESGTISMRRRQNTGGPDATSDNENDENLSNTSPGSAQKNPQNTPLKSSGELDLNVEKTCIVRLMDFLSDEQLGQVGEYLKEFFHYSPEFEASSGKSGGGKQVQINELDKNTAEEHVCFTITRNDGGEEVWMELVDASTNLKYYHNPDLNLTQWELPSEIQSYLDKEEVHPQTKD